MIKISIGWRWEIKLTIKSRPYSTPPSSFLPSSHLSFQLAVALHSRQAAGTHINNNNDFSCWTHRLGIEFNFHLYILLGESGSLSLSFFNSLIIINLSSSSRPPPTRFLPRLSSPSSADLDLSWRL